MKWESSGGADVSSISNAVCALTLSVHISHIVPLKPRLDVCVPTYVCMPVPLQFTPQQRREQMAEDAPQALRFESERFTVPELLFRPSDIGIKQGGVPHCIMQAIAK
jgi:Actin